MAAALPYIDDFLPANNLDSLRTLADCSQASTWGRDRHAGNHCFPTPLRLVLREERYDLLGEPIHRTPGHTLPAGNS